MTFAIVIDEVALKECVESNIFQSSHFEAGERLAKAIRGDKSVSNISPRLTAEWRKDMLYLLQSRAETGYLILSSEVFDTVPRIATKTAALDDFLTVFQRVCRFALKHWNHMSLSSPVETWSPKTDYGVVFPFPKSKHTGFRVTLRKDYEDRRVNLRHGKRLLYAFAGGVDGDARDTPDHERLFQRAFQNLQSVRSALAVQMEKIEAIPQDTGYHPLSLTAVVGGGVKFQDYDKWMARLTSEQRRFVTSSTILPQRVEGPAGTGKTLCLLLRAIYLCRAAEEAKEECRILFVAHSEATQNAMAIQLTTIDGSYHERDKTTSLQFIELKTLQEWCGEFLGERDIASAQYLDQDALTSKEMRKLLLRDVVAECLANDTGLLKYVSPETKPFFELENIDYVVDLLQHEIAIMIKGRASEKRENYLALPYLKYGLPVKNSNDRKFIYVLYSEYQQLLAQSGVYDTDDIVLSALARLDTPIWRRRREKEGYQAVLIDETHLFNLNELSVFHFLLSNPSQPRIIFSIDRSQAPGERGITTKMVKELLTGEGTEELETRTKLVFRCAPNIVRLAEAITSAAATLFTTFEDPLADVSTVIPATDEANAKTPVYWKCRNDTEMSVWVVTRLVQIQNDLKCPPHDILVVAVNSDLLTAVGSAIRDSGHRVAVISKRGDLEAVIEGGREGAVILAHPDYVGGLEFKAVLIVGVDEGRVPPTEGAVSEDSKHFLEFRSCNRLYVSISRARLIVELFYSAQRGRSSLLSHAIDVGALEPQNATVE